MLLTAFSKTSISVDLFIGFDRLGSLFSQICYIFIFSFYGTYFINHSFIMKSFNRLLRHLWVLIVSKFWADIYYYKSYYYINVINLHSWAQDRQSVEALTGRLRTINALTLYLWSIPLTFNGQRIVGLC
jgi:hypothetical protein